MWHLVRAFSLVYLKVMLQYFGSKYFGEEGERYSHGPLFFFFLVSDRLGLGMGALIEMCQRITNRNTAFYFSLKIITLVLVNDFQMGYMKQSITKGIVWLSKGDCRRC